LIVTFRFLPGALVLVSLLLLAACTRPAETADSSSGMAAALHARKCGSCHVPVEPGTRSRSHLESAFARHEAEKRVRLSAQQWDAMVEYLAPK
jgi:mono/diheme cytochrome c family protein